MVFKCSECGGELKKIGKMFKCGKCGRERNIEESKTIDMSKTANLDVIME